MDLKHSVIKELTACWVQELSIKDTNDYLTPIEASHYFLNLK